MLPGDGSISNAASMAATDGTRTNERTWPTVDERAAHGRSLRQVAPRSSHADWSPASDRFDPVELIEHQDRDRLPWLVPVRHGRMSESAFAFYRGAAEFMAADLAATPVSGLEVQLCGDAHLSNFGVFGSPERQLVFDVNDFDETLAGPWEWDVKRLATSFLIAAQHQGLDEATCRRVTTASVRHYREAMAEFGAKRALDVWYADLPVEELFATVKQQLTKKRRAEGERLIRKARSKDSLRALGKLAEEVDGAYRIKSAPPLVIPFRDIPGDVLPADAMGLLVASFEKYRSTLPDDRQVLLDRYRLLDCALKVVGVGSVGTRCFVLLLQGRDAADPLFLQIKEAGRSVLEEFLAPSPYRDCGQRVVEGQRLMQAASDIFLGWAESSLDGRSYYVRQLYDMKGSAAVEAADLLSYAHLCGWTLARAHARTGDPVAIAGYLGKGSAFDQAVTSFAERYAEQNLRDYEAFVTAIREGRLEADHDR
jgi:uncharacterized protein (DUF2252 family)